MLDEPLGRQPRHELVTVVHVLAAVEAQREGEGLFKIIGRGWRHTFIVGHTGTLTGRQRTDQEHGRWPNPSTCSR